MEKVLKFAILGCGHIATKMAAAVKTLEKRGMGVECYAVASRSLDKALPTNMVSEVPTAVTRNLPGTLR